MTLSATVMNIVGRLADRVSCWHERARSRRLLAMLDDRTLGDMGIDRATVAATKTIFATESDPREMQPYITACAKYDIIPKSFDAAELYVRS